MQISKRNGTVEAYEAGKIKRAMGAAFASVGTVLDDDEADRLIARIERAMEQRTAMLAGVSHDLRTILTRFKLELALLGDSPGLRPEDVFVVILDAAKENWSVGHGLA
ncbi:MAG: ATP cone domain-containing protein, partial [Eggerthella sp.]|nr:ATP cone domain-containing protein [Eggerthella sp.]